jgi:hypothetical protein
VPTHFSSVTTRQLNRYDSGLGDALSGNAEDASRDADRDINDISAGLMICSFGGAAASTVPPVSEREERPLPWYETIGGGGSGASSVGNSAWYSRPECHLGFGWRGCASGPVL